MKNKNVIILGILVVVAIVVIAAIVIISNNKKEKNNIENMEISTMINNNSNLPVKYMSK